MGTQFKILFYAHDDAIATTAFQDAFQRIADLDAILSDYADDSELTRLSRKSGGDPVAVSDDLWSVLYRADQIAQWTGGAFDVTVGPVVRLWRRARRINQIPSQHQIDQALTRVGMDKMRLDSKQQEVTLTVPKMLLDLGGIAKGYATQEAIDRLQKLGIQHAMVVGGGEVAIAEPPPNTDGWKIAIQPMSETEPEKVEYLSLSNAAVSTSGDSSQFVILDGRRFSHIVDPRTGWPIEQRRQVTVIAKDGMTADAIGSGLSVLGREHAERILKQVAGAACRIDDMNHDGQVETWTSKQWPNRIAH